MERTEQEGRVVVVGVDGSAASTAAVRYAVEACGEVDTVRVVHAVPTEEGAVPGYWLPPEVLAEAGRTLLRTTLESAGLPDDGAHVVAVLHRGGPVPVLARESRTAAAVVLGADRRRWVARVLTGDTTSGVAAASACPVVCVPEGWVPGGGAVVVGVEDPDRSSALVDDAVALAGRRGVGVRLIHAWSSPTAYDGLEVDRDAAAEWRDRAEQALGALGDAARSSGTQVEVELVHGQAAHVLVEASQTAGELVVGRRHHRVLPVPHLGSTARALLHHAHCPVRVVPVAAPARPGRRHRAPEVVAAG